MSRAGTDPKRLRAQLTEIRLDHGFRIIHRRFADTPLGCVPAPSRFSDPEGAYAVLYAALTVRCAVWEALLRDDYLDARRDKLPVEELESRTLVSLHSTEPLRLLDLRGDGTTRAKVPTAVTRDRRHAAGRALSAVLYRDVPEADGILYESRFVGTGCLALFDRALNRLDAFRTIELDRSPEARDAFVDADITLVTRRDPP